MSLAHGHPGVKVEGRGLRLFAVPTHPVTDFERAALASRLLTQEQIDSAWTALQQRGFSGDGLSFDQRLANQLVLEGRLNPWQAEQLLAGRKRFNLGIYWILDSIGRGGMGHVFKARDEMLGKIVAVKVLPRERATPEAIANFKHEIEAQAKLNHSNLVRALDGGEDGNVYYLVTEYVPGSDLRKLVRNKGPLNMEAAASVVSQIAAALQHAHEQGLVHRDVKPGNILVTPEWVAKLSDLGLAGPLEGAATSDPRFGRIVGTADYLSPDHIESPWTPTPAWDIYSLGCTLYYAVTGKVPFPGGSTVDKANAHLKLRPLDPRRLNPGLSAPFVEVMADMMAKDPKERIQTATAVISRLSPWLNAPARQYPARGAYNSVDPDDDEVGDTESSFPELPEPAAKEGTSQVLQATRPVAAAGDETASRLGMSRLEPEAVGPFGPLAVLVVFPLALVALILLLGWLLRML